MVCDQERCLLQEAGEHALIRHVWEGRYFGCSGVKGLSSYVDRAIGGIEWVIGEEQET